MPKFAITVLLKTHHQFIVESDGGPPIVKVDGLLRVMHPTQGAVLILPPEDLVRCELVPEEPRIVTPGAPS